MLEFEASWEIVCGQRLSANVFDTSIGNPITFATLGETEIYRNLGRIGTRGFEAAYRLRGEWGHGQATYSFYAPSAMDNVENYLVPGRTDEFLAAPAHRLTLSGAVRPLPWLSLGPTRSVRNSPAYQDGESVCHCLRRQ